MLKFMLAVFLMLMGFVSYNVAVVKPDAYIVHEAQEESFEQYVGLYSTNLAEDRGENPENSAGYDVRILDISDGNITFMLFWTGEYWSPIYQTSEITSKLAGNYTEFEWDDSWENAGIGTLTLIDGYIIINTIVTERSAVNRATLGTDGDLILLPKPE